ncbi:hypothetical protein IWW36_003807 [Coemansia brasiliensis]|uniref:tRNA-dihydrouridine synthase n=1 Tax=Coemansia brasiliensis TaxID=2650707 RepID=A0A9W8IAX2_9FUNG|nr:hypothetical protein IWW36_003807 [Coemansia brasiliensis]
MNIIRQLRTSVAPMVDVTDPCFLRLARLISPFGNHQLWTEMIHANAFARGHIHKDPWKLAQHMPLRELKDFASGVVVQIGSSSPDDAHEAVRQLVKLGVRNINLNCGCPSRNVQMGSFGAVLMKTPQLAADIVDAMSLAARGSNCRISVKCRVGVDQHDSAVFLQQFISEIVERTRHVDESSIGVILHARKAWLQGLSPKENRTIPLLNYDRVYEMLRMFTNTSFIVNGGIDSVKSVAEHLATADGVMMGRKIQEDPWFLSELDHHIYGIPLEKLPLQSDVLSQYVQFADQMHENYCSRYSVLGRPLFSFFRGRKGRALRAKLTQALAKAKTSRSSKHEPRYSAQFSEIVLETVEKASAEHRLHCDSSQRDILPATTSQSNRKQMTACA